MKLSEELRNKQSRDNRALLDRAADRIDELEAGYRKEQPMKDIEKQAIGEMSSFIMAGNALQKPSVEIAEAIYNEGYRKQSEGEWLTETGDWIYNVTKKYCSKCGANARYDKNMHEYILTKFCPNCGAHMKGGE